MNTLLSKITLLLGTIVLLASCGESKKQFEVRGSIANADTLMLYLEKRGHTDVVVLDSVKLKGDGQFLFKEDALDYSEFYLLRLKNQMVNFSIDSTETITISGDYATLSTNYTIEGSYSSEKIKETVLAQAQLAKDIASLRKKYSSKELSDDDFMDNMNEVVTKYKDEGRKMILEESKYPAAYFALFQKVDDMLIFDPNDKKDLYLFRAVATVWDTYHTKSPRTAQLKDYTLQAIANVKLQENQQATVEKLVTASTLNNKDYFDISLPNVSGKKLSTADLKGKVVILDFTVYQQDYSVAHNIRLNQAYEKYKPQIEIYQVSLDRDKHTWQNAADNLPWLCVRDEKALESALTAKYNLSQLPTTFILNKEGEIVKRLSVDNNISSEVAKVL